MELSSEDLLRLGVLIKNVEAIRIDENRMTVHGLSAKGEAKVTLNPTCRPERYLKLVREFLSGHALGSPGGYPVFLKRWTRMGEIKATYLKELLMLGEPEAVTAVARSDALTPELARKAWWAAPTSDHARRMLERDCVRQDPLGRELAGFLLEHLPFETEARTLIESVRLILQPGLIEEAARLRLWEKGAHKAAYRIGFLIAQPDRLPGERGPRPELAAHRAALEALAAGGNRLAAFLLTLLDTPGQRFLDAALDCLQRPTDQDSVILLFAALEAYFAPARLGAHPEREMARITAAVDHELAAAPPESELGALREAVPALGAELRAMRVLGRAGDELLIPVFSQTDAVGTVMRRRLEPVTGPLFREMAVLLGEPGLAATSTRRRRRTRRA